MHFTKINQIDDHDDAYVQLAEFGVYHDVPAPVEPSVEAEKQSVTAGEMFAFTATTSDDVARIALFNEYGLKVSIRDLSFVDNGDGSLTWTGKTSIGTAGSSRTLALALMDAEGAYTLTDASFTVEVRRPSATVLSAEIEKTGIANQPVTMTVVTNTAAKKIVVRNEYGLSMGTLSQAYKDTEEGRVWTVQIKVGTRGTRSFEVFAKNASGELSESVTTNSIVITSIA